MGNPTFRYHKELGAQVFDSDALPSESDGWFDSPKKANGAVPVTASPSPPVPQAKPAPPPKTLPTLDEYMSSVALKESHAGLSRDERRAAKARALADFAQMRYGAVIDTSGSLSEIVAQIEALEGKKP
jgi:hypothetical protein